MTDEEKQRMLLEERYATVRVQVRDAYDKCRFMQISRASNDNSIKLLEDKKHFFNRKKIQKNIDEILLENDNIDTMLEEIREYLEPLAKEMEELEAELGDRASIYYGRDDEWWIRK